MRCLTPIELIATGKTVPCGYCNFCLQRKRSDWSVRIFKEFQESESGYFLTLTYDEDHIMYGSNETGTLVKEHLQMFIRQFKQLQRRWERKNGHDERKIKHYSVGEYGTKSLRPHYHSILINARLEVLHLMLNKETTIWDKGQIYIGGCNAATINYVTKYLIDRDETHGDQKTFAAMTPALGKGYIDKNVTWHKNEGGDKRGFLKFNGKTVGMPRYYRDRIFTKEERELMNIKAEDEQEFEEWQELERLKAMDVENPTTYQREQRQLLHDKVRVKSVKLNKF